MIGIISKIIPIKMHSVLMEIAPTIILYQKHACIILSYAHFGIILSVVSIEKLMDHLPIIVNRLRDSPFMFISGDVILVSVSIARLDMLVVSISKLDLAADCKKIIL